MKKILRFSYRGGFAVALIYLVFTAIAYLLYPQDFSPTYNWLSDLGNSQISPSGSIIYNLGCILTALSLFLFLFGIIQWSKGNRRVKELAIVAQIAGILAALSLISTALFPLGTHTTVHIWSFRMLSIFLGFFLTFSAAAILNNPLSFRWLAFFGFLAALVNFIYGVFIYTNYSAEWVAVGMFILYIAGAAWYSKGVTNPN